MKFNNFNKNRPIIYKNFKELFNIFLNKKLLKFEFFVNVESNQIEQKQLFNIFKEI